jgi:hypothetical protein
MKDTEHAFYIIRHLILNKLPKFVQIKAINHIKGFERFEHLSCHSKL